LRELVMDTETTGLDCRNGDRLVEIAAIEVFNYIPTGRTYHQYINPQRDMPIEAFNVHGLSEKFLSNKPVFADIVGDFVEFLGDAKMVFQNASFDMGFINMELARASREIVAPGRIVDTLALARRKHPGGPNSLDALCKRYGIDNSSRTLHGALLDAQLLAEVYLQLSGGQQPVFDLSLVNGEAARRAEAAGIILVRPEPLPVRLDESEIAAHAAFVEGLGENALWRMYE
jgi:DNA polymerase-3 subunit epsilon